MLAIVCGAGNFEDVADFGQLKQVLLARHLALMRKMALNLLRVDTGRGSLKVKRKRLSSSA